MKKYKQLSQEQRYTIAQMIKLGKTKTEIAKLIDTSVSTVCREIKRNGYQIWKTGAARYNAIEAQRRSSLKRHRKPRFNLSEEQKLFIRERLYNERYSPELISVVGKSQMGSFVSHETIYKWIWYSKRSPSKPSDRHLYTFLRHGHRKRKRGNKNHSRGAVIPHRVSIDQRPQIVEQRQRPGDIEVDFMIGKDRKEYILVMTDRATLLTRLTKLHNRKAPGVLHAIRESIKSMPVKVHTLTFDNDRAFVLHHQLEGVQTFFTRPYMPQDKGTVENRIGVIRRFIPKKTDIRLLSYENVNKIESLINNRPVRKFNYLSPNQLIRQLNFALHN